jgi:hypothetical protein
MTFILPKFYYRILFIIGCISFTSYAHTQALSLTWQKVIGGSENEFAKCIEATSDGGYILGGETLSSASGNVTQTNPSGDKALIINKIATENPSVSSKKLQNTEGSAYIPLK